MKNLSKSVQLYITALAIVAGSILYHSITHVNLDASTAKAVLFFVVVSIVVESFTIRMPKGANLSVNFAVDLACIVLFGPNIAVWITSCSEIFKTDNIKGNTPYYKIIFNLSQLILSVWLGGAVYLYFGGKIDLRVVSSIVPFIGASLTYSFVNFSAVTVVLALVQKTSPWSIWLMNYRWVAPNFLAFTPLALLIATMYKLTGIAGVCLFFIPLLLARYIFKSYLDVRQVYLDTLGALAGALDAKDKYTKGHSDRVAIYAVEIARVLKIPEDKIEVIEHMALLHDIGKIGISGETLCKPGKLSDCEFDQIKQHPVIGANILVNIRDLGAVTDYVRFHHEKFNGTGYPYGLKGEEIPLEARIITLADSFDAMTSNRSYRKAMTMEEAVEEVKKSSVTHFDPKIVEAFLASLENGVISVTLNSSRNSEYDNLNVS